MRAWWRRPELDPKLRHVLLHADSAAHGADTDALRSRIVAAAGSRLARLRSPAPRWWEWITGWSRLAVPVGLAVSVAAVLLVQGAVTPTLTAVSADVGPDSTLALAAFSEPGADSELASDLIAPGGSDWLLEQAVSQ